MSYRMEGNELIYEMPKELDHHAAKHLCFKLDMLIESHRPGRLVFDFQNTEFMDSSGIGVVIGRCRMMQFRNGAVCAVHMGKRVRTIFSSAGLDKIVEVRGE